MTNSKILLAVFILLANFAFGQNNLFNFLSENDKALTKQEKAKIDRLKKNLVFKEFHVAIVGSVKALENRDKLPINLPNVKGILFAERTQLDALNENEFAQYNAELLSKGLHLVTYFENNTIVSKKLIIQHE